MIGFGSPTDKLRESVIVLMVSPLLALRLVIDHNTEQRMEFPRFFHHDRAWTSWNCRSNQRCPVLATTRCKLRILEPRRNEVSGIPNRRKSMFRAFFGRRGGTGGRPCILMPRHEPCSGPLFCIFFSPILLLVAPGASCYRAALI